MKKAGVGRGRERGYARYNVFIGRREREGGREGGRESRATEKRMVNAMNVPAPTCHTPLSSLPPSLPPSLQP